MSAELIPELKAVTGVLCRDDNRNPIVGRYAYDRQQVYKMLLPKGPRTAGQRSNSERFRMAALATSGIYKNPALLALWRDQFTACNGTYKEKSYHTLYGFIFAHLCDDFSNQQNLTI